jgi:hypothetical protein
MSYGEGNNYKGLHIVGQGNRYFDIIWNEEVVEYQIDYWNRPQNESGKDDNNPTQHD